MAVDPEKVAAPPDDLKADEAEGSADEAPADAQPKDDEPAYVRELRDRLERAEKDAKDARDFAQRAQGTNDRRLTTLAHLDRRVTEQQKQLDRALTANMSPEEKAQYDTARRLEQLEAERAQASASPGNDDPELREWQAFSSRALAKAGVKHDDPRLVEAFNKHNEGSKNSEDWPVALVAALSDLAKLETEKAKSDVQKERERATVRQKNDARAQEGRVDRSPAAGSSRKRVSDMTDAEFDAHWEAQKSGAAASARGQ